MDTTGDVSPHNPESFIDLTTGDSDGMIDNNPNNSHTGTGPARTGGSSGDSGGVTSGRITKPKATPRKKKPTAAAIAAAAAAAAIATAATPTTTPTKPRTKQTPTTTPATSTKKGKAASGLPACVSCKQSKARCDRIQACERCIKAGVECPGTGTGDDSTTNTASFSAAAGGKAGKSCLRCRRMKAGCVRKETCVRCEKKGVECVLPVQGASASAASAGAGVKVEDLE